MSENTNLPAKAKEYTPVEDSGALFDTALFEQLQRSAKAICQSSILPTSIAGSNADQAFANLMILFDQAHRWRMAPMSVVQCAGIVHGKLVFEGKLIAAVLEARGIDLDFEYINDPMETENTDLQKFGIKMVGTVRNKERWIQGTVADWRTNDKSGAAMPQWSTFNKARSQLFYRGTREWARLYQPKLLLGVYGDDEIDAMALARESRRPASQAPALPVGFADDGVIDDEQQEILRPVETGTDDTRSSQSGDDVDVGPDPEGSDEGNEPDLSQPDLPDGSSEGSREGTDPQRVSAERETVHMDGSDEEATDDGDLGATGTDGDPVADADGSGNADPPRPAKGKDRGKKGSPHTDAADQAGDEDGGRDTKVKRGKRKEDPEPEPTSDSDFEMPEAFENYFRDVDTLGDWNSLKQFLGVLTKLPEWKQESQRPGQPAIVEARRATFDRAMQIFGEWDVSDITRDLTLFRCYIEWELDPEQLADHFRYLQKTDLWESQSDQNQSVMSGAVTRRLTEIAGVN